MTPLIIIGAGPAALSASVYASRYKIEHRIFGQLAGGLMGQTHLIENWPGVESVSGMELTQNMLSHAKSYGAEIESKQVTDIIKNTDGTITVQVGDESFVAQSVLVATGTHHNELGVEGEKEFYGRGVSYCATCDAFFYRNKTAVVVGGWDSATKAALYLADLCKKVYLVHRRDTFRSEPIWVEKLQERDNVDFLTPHSLQSIEGDMSGVTHVVLDDGKQVDTDGVFIEIGSSPSKELFQTSGIELDDANYVVTNASQSTSVEGIWAAGDLTTGSNKFRQVLTAASEGVIAVGDIYEYLNQN